jgi:hypothetical protein
VWDRQISVVLSATAPWVGAVTEFRDRTSNVRAQIFQRDVGSAAGDDDSKSDRY